MGVERDLREQASPGRLRREGWAADRTGEEHGSAPDLIGELRARTEEARSLPGAVSPQVPYEAPQGPEPTAEVPLDLLRRVTAALVEARLALMRSNGAPEGAGSPSAQRAGLDAARMVALNMALNGAPRAETERYLRRHFTLSDPAQVAADAYRRRQAAASA